jgi:hypothetical protein
MDARQFRFLVFDDSACQVFGRRTITFRETFDVVAMDAWIEAAHFIDDALRVCSDLSYYGLEFFPDLGLAMG